MAQYDYEVLTQYNSPNYTPESQVAAVFGLARYIEGITYHWWGDPALRPIMINIIMWLCRAGGNTSANTVGEDGRVAWIVDAINAAWHAGNARGNARSIGYECNPRLSDGDYEAMGRFHYDMEIAYGRRLAIWVHKEWTQTSCSPIDKDRIRRIADGHHNYVEAKPSVAVPAAQPLAEGKIQIRAKLPQVQVWDLATNPDYKSVKTFNQGDVIDVVAFIDFNNTRYYLTQYSYDKGLKTGINRNDIDIVVPEVVKPEWMRNFDDNLKDEKYTVLPAAGTKVLDLNTLLPVNNEVIPKGTQIDIVAQTTVGGKKFYISSYAKNGLKPWGILASELGIPVNPPAQEKPEWMKNLQDIADKDMWTRSVTPVLDLATGTTVDHYPINKQVRITHATQIAGNELLVLDGGKQAIEILYLNDKPVSDPHDDIEKRLTAIEKFLDSLFKNFRKGA